MKKLKKILFTLLVSAFVFSGAVVVNADGKITMNGVAYGSIQEAITAAGNEAVTIEVNDDLTGDFANGFITQDGQNITINLNGHSIDFNSTVGSTGTETLGMQLLKGSIVTIKNGSLFSNNPNCKMLIQNYSTLTLENVTVDGSKNGALYAVSNNNGSLTAKGNTVIIAAQDQVAFDLWYGMNVIYDDGITVTFGEDFTGSVTGKIEYGAASRARNTEGWREKAALIIANGTWDIEFANGSAGALEGANITITGGVFTNHVSDYLEDDAIEYTNNDGKEAVITRDELILRTYDEVAEATEEQAALVQGVIEEGYTVGQYYDITLWLAPSDADVQVEQVTEPAQPVDVTITLPNNLPALQEGYVRTYKIIRIHNGVAEVLNAVDNKNGTVTFQTSKFSTYALTYTDTLTQTAGATANPNTGDDVLKYISIFVVSSLVLVGGTLYLKKRFN